MELIALPRKAITWHHYCQINSTEPLGESFFNPMTIGIMLKKRTSSGVTYEHVQ